MSYILNALRKSEQSRRSNQTPTLDSGIVHPQPVENKRNTLLIMVLIAIVVILAGALFWLNFGATESTSDNTDTPLTNQGQEAIQSIEPMSQATKPEPQKTEQPIETKTQNEIEIQRQAASTTPGFAEIIALKKQKNVAALTPKKQNTDIETPVNEAIDASDLENALAELTQKPSTQAIQDQQIQTLTPESQPVKAVNKQPNNTVKPKTKVTERATSPSGYNWPQKQAKQDYPYLKDMPFKFRRSVPRININVYVYADLPKDRFVMVDMVKFKAGENITEGMLLKEILSDALLVSYEGKTFKIKRP